MPLDGGNKATYYSALVAFEMEQMFYFLHLCCPLIMFCFCILVVFLLAYVFPVEFVGQGFYPPFQCYGLLGSYSIALLLLKLPAFRSFFLSLESNKCQGYMELRM